MTNEQASELLALLRGLNEADWCIRDAMYLKLDEKQRAQFDKLSKERRGTT